MRFVAVRFVAVRVSCADVVFVAVSDDDVHASRAKRRRSTCVECDDVLEGNSWSECTCTHMLVVALCCVVLLCC